MYKRAVGTCDEKKETLSKQTFFRSVPKVLLSPSTQLLYRYILKENRGRKAGRMEQRAKLSNTVRIFRPRRIDAVTSYYLKHLAEDIVMSFF